MLLAFFYFQMTYDILAASLLRIHEWGSLIKHINIIFVFFKWCYCFFFKDEVLILESIFYYIVKMIHLRDLGSNFLSFFCIHAWIA